ncbi:MAG TPA: lactate racemase domain-containing protein, partial [Candidatus Bathyarchaeia archaeon]|nr:lactate racemase domain-containing protein [Candidatus Bathyarchaeia archaeon]
MPYGETEIPIRVPDENFYKILEPKKPSVTAQLSDQIENSLAHPVNDLELSNLSKPGTIAGVLIDPIVPASVQKQAVDTLKVKLKNLGIERIKFFYRRRTSNAEPPSSQEGTAFNPIDPNVGAFTDLGRTSKGTEVHLETELLQCDLKIAISIVTPHFASGFTGGPDLLVPGASSFDTITKNRSLMVKGIPNPRDTLQNMVLSDSLEAYKMAGHFYSMTFVPDGWGGVDTAFSGELEAAFREAVRKYVEVHSPRLDRRSDVVVVAAGKLLGMDLYHAVRVLSNAFEAVRKEGTVILVAECSKGIGDSGFLEFSRRFAEKRELVTELRRRFRLG